MMQYIDPQLLEASYPPNQPLPSPRSTDGETQPAPLYHPHYVLCTDGYYRLPIYYAPEQALTQAYPEPMQMIPGPTPGPVMPMPPQPYHPSYYPPYPQPPEMRAEPIPQSAPQQTYQYLEPSSPPAEGLWWEPEPPSAVPELSTPTFLDGQVDPISFGSPLSYPSPSPSSPSSLYSPPSELSSPASSPSPSPSLTLGTPLPAPPSSPVRRQLRPRSARAKANARIMQSNAGTNTSPSPSPSSNSGLDLALDLDSDGDADSETTPIQPLSEQAAVPNATIRAFLRRGAEERMVRRPDGSRAAGRPLNAFMLYRKFYYAHARRILSASGGPRPRSLRRGRGRGTQGNVHLKSTQFVGASWRNETTAVRAAFADHARAEARMHAVLFPDYKYRPRPAGSGGWWGDEEGHLDE